MAKVKLNSDPLANSQGYSGQNWSPTRPSPVPMPSEGELLRKSPDPASTVPKDPDAFPRYFYGENQRLMDNYETKVAELRHCLLAAENPADLRDDNQKRLIFGKLSYGLRKSGDYLGWALYHSRLASIKRKEASAIAAIDEFPKFILKKKDEGNELKATEEVRKHYVNLDKEAIEASKNEALWEAIVEQLSTMKTEFMMAISTIKSMAYGHKEADTLSSYSNLDKE